MKRVFLFFVCLLFFLAAVPAGAQAEPSLAFFQVQLWPEYDQPAMLVIYTLQLPDEVELPALVSLHIPASVGDPTAVAVADDSGLVTRDYTRTENGEWATITLEADFPVVQLEYYDFSLSQSQNPRSYTFVWPGDYAVDEFLVNVQQPVNATNMTIEPALEAPAQGGDGLFYHSASLGSLPAGEEITISLSYTKNDTGLSVETLSSQSVPPAVTSQPAASSSGNLPVWVWVLVGVGTGFVVLGVVYFIRSSQASRPSSYRSKKSRSADRSSRSSGKKVFCHNCGHPAGPEDKFCRECGTKLRL